MKTQQVKPMPCGWKLKACVVCGVQYCTSPIDGATGFYRVYCSIECIRTEDDRKESRRLERERIRFPNGRPAVPAPAEIPPIECKNCGGSFVPRKRRQVFCSWECSNEWQTTKKPRMRNYLRLFERDFFRCIYCGRSSIEHGVKLVLDHVYPHSRGGLDVASNLVTSCMECNGRKQDRVFKRSILERVLWVVAVRNERDGIVPDSPVEWFEYRSGKGTKAEE